MPALLPEVVHRLQLLLQVTPSCPGCGQALATPAAEGQRRGRLGLRPGSLGFCRTCAQQLGLPGDGLRGCHPLRWWSSGAYAGPLRQLLLNQRRQPERPVIAGLTATLALVLPEPSSRPWLVPIPSWKRQGNPLPAAICCSLAQQRGWRRVDLLQRSAPRIGQHHLNRQQRLQNQEGAFLCRRQPLTQQARRHPLLLVDDILTTGSTLASAAACLQAAGWQVQGAVCLARTPVRRARWSGS